MKKQFVTDAVVAIFYRLVTFLFPLVSCIGESSCLNAADKQPNIICVLADDLGFGDVQCFNAESKIATPNLDRLASEGMRFTNAHAPASICVPSRYGLLTGRMPYRNWDTQGTPGVRKQTKHGVETLHFPQPQLQHEPKRLNLATLLKRQGYATACVGKWHQGMSATAQADGKLKITPLDFGFDYYFGFDAPEQGPYAFIENKQFVAAPTESIEEHLGVNVTNPETQGAHWRKGWAAPSWKFEDCLPTLASKADAWLTKQAAATSNAPFFLYYSLPAPHAPWVAGAEFQNKSRAGQYGDYVMTVDAAVGQLMATLERLKLKDNTLIFFTSDNGPVWYREDIAKYNHRAAGPFKGMKGSLTEAGHRMPFIACWPGKIITGSTCEELVCFTDVMATVATLIGEKLPDDAGEDSFDISSLLYGERPRQPIRSTVVHVNYGSYNLAIRNGDWKLILPEWVHTVKDGTITPNKIVAASASSIKISYELYNLRSDPGELNNLAETNPDKVQSLFELLQADIQRGRSR